MAAAKLKMFNRDQHRDKLRQRVINKINEDKLALCNDMFTAGLTVGIDETEDISQLVVTIRGSDYEIHPDESIDDQVQKLLDKEKEKEKNNG